ncbi:MAG: hypothetical protein F6K28_55615 [Microcoleus sp. SIO2G3]|nr:hypothetical protein [Microcoleus sp. SIO2G3]
MVSPEKAGDQTSTAVLVSHRAATGSPVGVSHAQGTGVLPAEEQRLRRSLWGGDTRRVQDVR